MRRPPETARSVPLAALALALAACGGGDGPTEPAASTGSASVTVEPQRATLTAIEATQSFSASATDADGAAVPADRVSWSTTDSTVAGVDPSGTATARAPGAVNVIASFRGAADTALLRVSPEVAALSVSPATATVAGNGGTVQLSVEAEDRNGHEVSAATVAWSSSDTVRATVDQAGLVTGHRLGEADIEARVGDVAATAAVVVEDPPGDDPPLAEIRAPEDGSVHALGDAIAFAGSAYDLEEGELSGASLVWRSSLDGQIGTGAEFSTSGLSEGEHQITLVATDAGGQADTAAVAVDVRVGVNLTVDRLLIGRRGILDSETQEIGAVVSNSEISDAGAFDWSLRVDGTVVATGRLDGVAAGDTAVVPVQTGLGPFAQGRHEVLLELDTGGEVTESSEADNEAGGRFHSYPRGFDIELRFLSVADSSKLEVFRRAEERWEELVTSELPDVPFSQPENLDFCAEGAGTLDRPVDDVLIYVRLDSIDGLFNILGRAGPCLARETAEGELVTTVVGGMVFDVADLGFLEAEGQLEATIVHEMGHVLGIGTLWPLHGLLDGAGTSDPVYTGTAGREGFREVGGDSYAGTPVPVENTGDPGTVDSHWRESVFDDELMTGFINPDGNPLSVVTVGSLRDQFLAVDESRADPYQLPTGGALRAGAGIRLGDDLLGAPLYGVAPDGTVRPLDRRRFREPR